MSTLATVQAYFGAWQARDADAVLASLTADGTYEDPSSGGPIGGEVLRAYVTGIWSAFPDLHFEIESLAETGTDRAAAQWRMLGTNTGSMRGLPPTGKPVSVPGSDFFALRDRKVASVTGYFDGGAVPRHILR